MPADFSTRAEPRSSRRRRFALGLGLKYHAGLPKPSTRMPALKSMSPFRGCPGPRQRWTLAVLCALLLGGCGQTGELYLSSPAEPGVREAEEELELE